MAWIWQGSAAISSSLSPASLSVRRVAASRGIGEGRARADARRREHAPVLPHARAGRPGRRRRGALDIQERGQPQFVGRTGEHLRALMSRSVPRSRGLAVGAPALVSAISLLRVGLGLGDCVTYASGQETGNSTWFRSSPLRHRKPVEPFPWAIVCRATTPFDAVASFPSEYQLVVYRGARRDRRGRAGLRPAWRATSLCGPCQCSRGRSRCC